MTSPFASRIAGPRAPEQPAPFRFPVIVAVAPVIVSVLIWLITGSAFALIFAALGPVTAIATWVDSRVGAKRLRRRESARFRDELAGTIAEIARRHDIERSALRETAPDAVALLTRHGADPYRWRVGGATEALVTVGHSAVRSTLELDPPPNSDPKTEIEYKLLAARASALEDAPVSVDGRLGVGICGSGVVAASLVRALSLQLAWLLSPADFWLACGAIAEHIGDLEWLTELPHERGRQAARSVFVEFGLHGEEESHVTLALAATSAELPGGCRVVIEIGEQGAEIIHHPDPIERRRIRPVGISREQARTWARRAGEDARQEGLASARGSLPESVELHDLFHPTESRGRESLACEPAVGTVGPVVFDLVEHGPHAVVGGTTGSGKSELLIAWVLAMAATRSPDDVTFLLVDFKGGSAFGALTSLPHTVGLITDLDEEAAARALQSLRAEVRFRERHLATEGARSIDEIATLPRLVIVVDEFAAMLADHPDLHALFADLAARGRSLGIHLVLCTQRPSGVVRDGILANADLRVSLRVNNRADSTAVVGTDSAAAISAQSQGQGIVKFGGAQAQLVQFARARPTDIDLVRERWLQSPAPRRPWCDPLPQLVRVGSLGATAPGIPFGLIDLPEEQRQETASYLPADHGHLIVIGAPGSGKTTALEVLATGHGSTVRVPSECDAAWDVVGDLIRALDDDTAQQGAILAVLDDLDSVIPRFGGEHRGAFVEALGRVLRDGPGRGIHLALSAQRLSGEVQSLAALVPQRIMLRHASRQEFVMAGGDGATYSERLPPGGGIWRGHRVQIAHVPVLRHVRARPREVALAPARPLAIVTSRPARLLAQLPGATPLADAPADVRSLVALRTTVVGDVDEWQSRWGAIAAIREHAEVLFDGCSPADFRVLTRSRVLPPPIAQGLCWRLNDDGSASRARLPA